MRVERAKATIQRRFGNVLDALAADFPWPTTVTNPLFVLPIDDFDLNPPRVLNLLRVIRMLHYTPVGSRLFSIICGNRKLAEDFLELQFFNDATKDSEQLARNESLLEHFRVEARRSAAFAIRKLLPPAQVARLGDMQWWELMAFRPEAKDDSVKEILGRIPFDIAPNHEILWTSKPVKRIHDIDAFVNGIPFGNLSPPQASANQGQPAEKTAEGLGTFYSVHRNLTAPVRNAVDTWQRLRKLLAVQPSRPLTALDTILVDIFNESVRTDTTLTEIIRSEDDQHAIECIFERRSMDFDPMSGVDQTANEQDAVPATTEDDVHWFCNRSTLKIHYDTSFDSVFGRLQSPIDAPEIVGWQQGDWKVDFAPDAGKPEDSKKNGVSRPLSHRTKGLFTLTHDLLALDERAVLFESATPAPSSVKLAAAQWQGPSGRITMVPWLAPNLDSFWEWDHFSHIWFGLIQALRKKLGSLFFGYDIAAELGYRWIFEGTAIVDLRSFPSELYTASGAAQAVAHPENGWPTLCDRLLPLFRAVAGPSQGGTVQGSSNPASETRPEVPEPLVWS